MSTFNIDTIISNLPDDIKQNTQIDENINKLKKEKDLEKKKKLIEKIQREIDYFADTLSDNNEKQKLIEVKKQLDKIKISLNSLQQQIKNNKNLSKEKVFEVTEKIEED
jgi:hypothetical protein